jgi:hypothetical protein
MINDSVIFAVFIIGFLGKESIKGLFVFGHGREKLLPLLSVKLEENIVQKQHGFFSGFLGEENGLGNSK